jgi:hypothetical protein
MPRHVPQELKLFHGTPNGELLPEIDDAVHELETLEKGS